MLHPAVKEIEQARRIFDWMQIGLVKLDANKCADHIAQWYKMGMYSRDWVSVIPLSSGDLLYYDIVRFRAVDAGCNAAPLDHG